MKEHNDTDFHDLPTILAMPEAADKPVSDYHCANKRMPMHRRLIRCAQRITVGVTKKYAIFCPKGENRRLRKGKQDKGVCWVFPGTRQFTATGNAVRTFPGCYLLEQK